MSVLNGKQCRSNERQEERICETGDYLSLRDVGCEYVQVVRAGRMSRVDRM